MRPLSRYLVPISVALSLYFFTFLALHFLPHHSPATAFPRTFRAGDESHVSLNLRQPMEAWSDPLPAEDDPSYGLAEDPRKWVSAAPEELRDAEQRYSEMTLEDLGEDEELYFNALRARARKLSLQGQNGAKELFVSFVDAEFAPFALNWVGSLRRLGLLNSLVLVNDKQAFQILHSKGINVFLILPQTITHLSEDPQTALLQARWRYTIEILKGGVNVIMSDIDVVWLNRPFFPADFDVMTTSTSAEHDHLTEMEAELGTCYLASNNRVIYLLRQLLQDSEDTRNDEHSLNSLLVRSFLSPDLPQGTNFNLTDVGKTYYTLSPPIRLLVFLESVFSHRCKAKADLVAVHCVSKGSSHMNALSLMNAGLWLLDDKMDLVAGWAPRL